MVSEETKRTLEVLEKLEKTTGRPFSRQERFIDLVEEVGELANAMLAERGAKHEKRKKADIDDSLCDILFNLIVLADNYGIDLKEAYHRMLDELEERIRNRDFAD